QALCRVLARPGLAADPELAGVEGRRRRQPEIEEAISAWTRRHRADEAMALLQAAAVPAGAVRPIPALLHDPHLAARGFWRPVAREHVGSYLAGGSFYREAGQSAPLRHAAPTLGQHNAEVLGGILGLSPQRLDELAARGVIGSAAVPKP
ncbi:MAG TPA: CoA transferase, partial [Acetobacteraceae bacterium]